MNYPNCDAHLWPGIYLHPWRHRWRYIPWVPWGYPFLEPHPYIPYHLFGHISHSIPMSLLYPMYIYICDSCFSPATISSLYTLYIITYIYLYMSYVLCICTQYIQLTSFNSHIPFIEYKHHIYIYYMLLSHYIPCFMGLNKYNYVYQL